MWIPRIQLCIQKAVPGPGSRTSDQHMATRLLSTEKERKLNTCLSQELGNFSVKEKTGHFFQLCGLTTLVG